MVKKRKRGREEEEKKGGGKKKIKKGRKGIKRATREEVGLQEGKRGNSRQIGKGGEEGVCVYAKREAAR